MNHYLDYYNENRAQIKQRVTAKYPDYVENTLQIHKQNEIRLKGQDN